MRKQEEYTMANKYAGTQTEKNLEAAFAGESMARNKYTYYASKAKKEGYEQIAALFLKTAENEKEHAKLWFKELHDGMPGTATNLLDAAEGKEVEIHRLPGLGKVKRNDVLVFHYPYPHKNDSLSMHLLKYYVKRCIALPGDTMGIWKGHYYIKGINEPIGNIEAQKRIEKLQKENARGIVMDAYPWDKYINWTIQDFGPLHVPARGQTVVMDSTAVKLYRNLIEWEQKEKLTFQGKEVFLGDSLIQKYCFQENYYFMGGDYMENSKDSRYWGLLPEPYIVGVATRIWKSVDKSTGKIRWDRVMKKIE